MIFQRNLIFLILSFAISLSIKSTAAPLCQEVFNGAISTRNSGAPLTFEEARKLSPQVPRSFVDLAGPNTRKIESIQDLKVFEFNVENLFLRHASFLRENQQVDKPAAQLEAIARIIVKADPDFCVLPEVDSIGALSEFNTRYLSGRFRPLLLEGNDSRGIDVGVLVKADLPFDVEMRSFTYMKEEDGDPIFSRDLPVWIIRESGSSPSSAPLFVLAGTHYKSLIGSKKDPHGTMKRQIQAETSAQILTSLEKEFGGNVPIILTGDFNNDIYKSPEFQALRNAGFQDSIALSGKPPQPTHAFFTSDGTPAGKPIDSIMLNAAFQKMGALESANVLSHLDKDGHPLPFPRSFEERNTRPSDHVPSMAVINFSRVLSFLKIRQQQ